MARMPKRYPGFWEGETLERLFWWFGEGGCLAWGWERIACLGLGDGAANAVVSLQCVHVVMMKV